MPSGYIGGTMGSKVRQEIKKELRKLKGFDPPMPLPKITPAEEAELWKEVAMLGRMSSVSRKKQAVPNDPIQQAKQKMLERAVQRKVAASPIPNEALAPLKERQAALTEKLKEAWAASPTPPTPPTPEAPMTPMEIWDEKQKQKEQEQEKQWKDREEKRLENVHRGIAVLERLDQFLDVRRSTKFSSPAPLITHLEFSSALEPGLNEMIRRSSRSVSPLPRDLTGLICGQYDEIDYSLQESEEFFVRCYAGKQEVMTIREGGTYTTGDPSPLAYHPTRLPPLEALMPDIAALPPHPFPPGYTPTTIPATSTSMMTWETKLPSTVTPIFTAGAAPEIGMSEAATKAWKEKFETPPAEPLVMLRTDRPSTPKDALGPEPGIVRQTLLATAEWPRSISIAKSSLAGYDERVVRYIFEDLRLYFWLANGCAIYDVNESLDGKYLEGKLLHGSVFPLLSGLPKISVNTTLSVEE